MTHPSRPLDFHLPLPRFYCRKVSNQIFEISTLAISDDAGNTQVAASTNKSCLPFRLFEQYFRWIMCSPLFFVSTPLKHCAEITNALWTWVTIFCWNYWKYFHAKSLALKIFQIIKSFPNWSPRELSHSCLKLSHRCCQNTITKEGRRTSECS